MSGPELPEDGWLIHKAGRGWYRPKAQGYTADTSEAGRYSYQDALSYSHPNGWNGPRDGITIKREGDLRKTHHEYIRRDPAVIAALPEVQAIVGAAQPVIDRWDSPRWGGSVENLRHTGEYIAGLRLAIAAIRKRGEG